MCCIRFAGGSLRVIGCVLMFSGWLIALAALALLARFGQRCTFVGAGMAVEVLGLALLAQSYRELEKGAR